MYSFLAIGVVDSELKDKRDVDWENKHAVCYFGSSESAQLAGDGRKKKIEGIGFRAGERVTVTVEGETISWKVNGQKVAHFKMPKLQDESVNWVPFIKMSSKGDVVELMG